MTASKAPKVDEDFQAAKRAISSKLGKPDDLSVADLVKLCETMAKLKTAESKGGGDPDGFGGEL
jgi:hypothetical protein